jgi:hypothetical protein
MVNRLFPQNCKRNIYFVWPPCCYFYILQTKSNSMEQSLSENLIVNQLVKKCSAFYGNQSLLCLQDSITVTFPKLAEYVRHLHNIFKIHFNIILSSTRRSPKCFHSSGLPTKYMYAFLNSLACYIPRPSHPNVISFQVPNILLSTFFSDTLRLNAALDPSDPLFSR